MGKGEVKTLIIYRVVLTAVMKSVVRETVDNMNDDEFVILFDDDHAIHGEKRGGKVVITEVLKYL